MFKCSLFNVKRKLKENMKNACRLSLEPQLCIEIGVKIENLQQCELSDNLSGPKKKLTFYV